MPASTREVFYDLLLQAGVPVSWTEYLTDFGSNGPWITGVRDELLDVR